jgi:hypothetical protein
MNQLFGNASVNWVSSSPVLEGNDFDVFTGHLPDCVKEALNNFHPTSDKLEKNVQSLKNPSECKEIFKASPLSEISYIVLKAFHDHQFSKAEATSLHLMMAAKESFILNPKSFSTFEKDDGTKTTYCIDLKKHFNPATFLTDFQIVSINENSSELAKVLKQYFQFSDFEYASFLQLMQKEESPLEQWGSFWPVQRDGSFSNLHSRLKEVTSCFQTPSYQNKTRFFIPSFSMLQNFLKVKGARRKRKAIELVSFMGVLSEKELGILKRQGQTPLGIYCPAPHGVEDKILKALVDHFDEFVEENPIHFSEHDILHAIREMEMFENLRAATFRIVDLLDEYVEICPPEELQKAQELRTALIDGELFFNYSRIFSLFLNNPEGQCFGTIFPLLQDYWTDKTKKLVLVDMVKNASLWKSQFGITRMDLLSEDQVLLDEMIILQFFMGDRAASAWKYTKTFMNIQGDELEIEDFSYFDHCILKKLISYASVSLNKCNIEEIASEESVCGVKSRFIKINAKKDICLVSPKQTVFSVTTEGQISLIDTEKNRDYILFDSQAKVLIIDEKISGLHFKEGCKFDMIIIEKKPDGTLLSPSYDGDVCPWNDLKSAEHHDKSIRSLKLNLRIR